MITLYEILSIHNDVITDASGLKGVRDEGGLIAAISRPYQTFDGQELYPNPVDEAAAVFESLIVHHPFIDGNKRTAYVAMRMVLMDYYYDIHTSEEIKYNFVISAASGKLSFDEIKAWITQNTITVK